MKPQDEALFKEPSATKQEREQQQRGIAQQGQRPASQTDKAAAEHAKEEKKKGDLSIGPGPGRA